MRDPGGAADWTGKNMPMQKVIRQLLEHQIDLDIVCLDMLDDLAAYNGRLDGKKLDDRPSFSGIACYEKTVYLDEAPERAALKAEHVFEMMKVTVNGSEAGVRIFPPYQVEIGGALKAGENKIVVEVAGTPMREMLEIPQPPFDFSHEALEPMGMFGKVELLTV